MSSTAQTSANTRYVGIRPRVKQTAKIEARPTQVTIVCCDGNVIKLDLGSEQDELDFVLGVFPTAYRKVVDGEDLSMFRAHHIQLDKDDKPVKVPSAYEGFRRGDIVAMAMGGCGDYLAHAFSRKGEMINATIVRIPPFTLDKLRLDGAKKDDDAELLAQLAQEKPGLFTPVYVRDRQIVMVRELQRLRIDTMKARIGCAQRLRQRFIGQIFCSKDGLFPEGAIEKEFDIARANDVVLLALEKEEARIDRELKKAVEATDVWKHVMSQVEGLGPSIGARLISVIQDIRRFKGDEQLKKYVGAHAKDDKGKFPRRRAGQVAGWSNEARQALFLLTDQFNRRPDSVWGKKFISNKAHYKARYPHPELVFEHEGKEKVVVLTPGSFEKKGAKYLLTIEGVKVETVGKLRHFTGHIHKMAGWKTSTQFVEWLFAEWWKIEKTAMGKPVEPTAPTAPAEGTTSKVAA